MTQPDPQETIAEEQASARRARAAAALGESETMVDAGDPNATVLYAGHDRPAAAAAALTLVAGYEILEELGRGGMGVVYKARQLGLNRLVALKMILAGAHASADVVARFRTEAEAAASLQHPNIVQIYDIGEQDGKPFFSLEYVEGGNLAEQLNGTPQAPRQAAKLMETLARTVHAAHLRGIVHRDLKPVNVLLTPDGVPKIADFGLAKRIDGEQGQTESGSILGSPSYMAPEQAEGKTREIGPAADVYALGAILYELLTGRPPFRAETAMRTMQQVVEVDPVAPSRLLPGLPQDIETICLKCLQKEPLRRYASAEALAEDLRRFQADEPIVARPIGWLERSVRWCRRNPVQAILASSVLLLLITVAGVALFAAVRLSLANQATRRALQTALDEARRADAEATAARKERQRADEKAQSLSDQLYLHSIVLAQSELQSNRVARTEHLLTSSPEALRNWEWYYLKRQCHAELMTLRGHTSSVPAVALSPDGKTLASGGDDGSIRLWDTATGKQRNRIPGHTWAVTSLAFSPDGSRLASGSLDQSVRIRDTASGETVATITGLGMPVHAVAFSPSGDLVASAGGDDQRDVGELRLWDAATGQPRRSLRVRKGVVRAVAFRPDGRQLASAGSDGLIRLWSLPDGKPGAVLSGHSSPIRAVAYLPDGERLVSGGDDAIVRLWDPAETEPIEELPGHTGAVLAVAAGRAGDRVASASADGSIRLWTAGQAGWTSTPYRGHLADVQSLAFGPKDRLIASSDAEGAVKLWDATQDPRAAILGPAQVVSRGLAFSPDGRLVASAGADNLVRIWDAATHDLKQTLKGHTAPVLAVAFSHDGRSLASASADATARVWDTRDWHLRHTLKGHRNDMRDIAFSPDGRLVATASTDTTLRLWDAGSGTPAGTLEGHAQEVTSLAFHPDGAHLVSGSRDRTVKVWRLKDRQCVRTLRDATGLVLDVAFSPEGRLLAAGDSDGTITLWDTDGWEMATTLDGHTGPVSALGFSSDGKRLRSASWDRTVRLWDVGASQEILALRVHPSEVRSLAISPDRWRIASGGGEGGVRLFDASERPARAR